MSRFELIFFGKVAGVTGLEPAASGVTGRRSNQLSYTPTATDCPRQGGQWFRLGPFTCQANE